jgi:hypothetical protein
MSLRMLIRRMLRLLKGSSLLLPLMLLLLLLLLQWQCMHSCRFDTGGQGIAYNDVTANSGAATNGSPQIRPPEKVGSGGSGFIGFVGVLTIRTLNLEYTVTYTASHSRSAAM